MPRVCTVCRHTARDAIDAMLVDSAAYRDIAARFGLSRSALVRHKADHLPATLTTAKAVAEETRGATLLDRVNALHDRALAILDLAEREGDFRVALAAIREARGVMDLLVKITGPVPAEPVPTLLYGFDPDLVFPDPPKYIAEWGTADGNLPPFRTPRDDGGSLNGRNSPGAGQGRPSA